MAFIQIIEFKTSKFDDMRDIDRQWEKATEGKRTLQRRIITRDRNDPSRYRILAFFDSYQSAMENSALPETQHFADQMTNLMEGPPSFVDLDVLEDKS